MSNESLPVIFCAYNGFKFDFMLLVKNLDHYGIDIDPAIWLIDPYHDRRVFLGWE